MPTEHTERHGSFLSVAKQRIFREIPCIPWTVSFATGTRFWTGLSVFLGDLCAFA